MQLGAEKLEPTWMALAAVPSRITIFSGSSPTSGSNFELFQMVQKFCETFLDGLWSLGFGVFFLTQVAHAPHI
jgi:hypothetical protein